MKKSKPLFKITLLAVLTLISLSGCSSQKSNSSSDLESRIEQLEETNEDLTMVIKILSDRIQKLEDKN